MHDNIGVSIYMYIYTCTCVYIYACAYLCVDVCVCLCVCGRVYRGRAVWFRDRKKIVLDCRLHVDLDTWWRRPIGCLRFCISFFAKEPLIIGLFCGKRSIKMRHPMGLRHPVQETSNKQRTRNPWDTCYWGSLKNSTLKRAAHTATHTTTQLLRVMRNSALKEVYVSPSDDLDVLQSVLQNMLLCALLCALQCLLQCVLSRHQMI